jgi:hypothetical protein
MLIIKRFRCKTIYLLLYIFQIKTAISEREKAVEMKDRLLRILGDRDVFLEKLAESRKRAFEVQYSMWEYISLPNNKIQKELLCKPNVPKAR